jgi:Spy/CpxP family protein refolding chaperone
MILALAVMPAFGQSQKQGRLSDDRPREEGFASEQGPGGPSDERRDEIRRKIEAIRIWRLTEELRLDSNTSAQLAALLSSLEQKRRDIQREQMETIRSIRQMLRSQKPDEAKLKQLLNKLENNHRAVQELRYAELKGVKEFLSVEQQARFLLFQQEFQREIQGMIANARGGQGMRRQGQGFQGGPGRDFRGMDGPGSGGSRDDEPEGYRQQPRMRY